MIEKNWDSRWSNVWFQPLLLGMASLYLYLNSFTLSNLPYLRRGDQTFFWEYALRMLQGEHVYRDFFQFTPPGSDLFYLALFRIFGPKIWVTDLAIIILGVAICRVCFEAASQIMDRSWAVLSAALYLVFVYGRILDATHHWFGLFAVVCGIRILLPERTVLRVASAGVLLGVASIRCRRSLRHSGSPGSLLCFDMGTFLPK